MPSKKQIESLKRGSDIRMTRGALALLKKLSYRYSSNNAGFVALNSAIQSVEDWHNLQFGFVKCKICGCDLNNPLRILCTKPECSEIFCKGE